MPSKKKPTSGTRSYEATVPAAVREVTKQVTAVHEIARQIDEYQRAMKEFLGIQPFVVQQNALLEFSRRVAHDYEAMGLIGSHEAIRQLNAVEELAKQLKLKPEASSLSLLATRHVPSFTAVAREEPTVAERADPVRAIPHFETLKQTHAPPNWSRSEEKRFAKQIAASRPLELIVLAADIRASTALMKEAIDPYQFAATLEAFTASSRKIIWDNRGIFDKFTGDGLLAYWSFIPSNKDLTLRRVLGSIKQLHTTFMETYLPEFRGNSQNFPGGVGLAVGLDEGPTNVVAMADDPTIVGPAVVGAVRMVGAATTRETLVNVRLGEYLTRAIVEDRLSDLTITSVFRTTKEYADQTAYALGFPNLVLPEG